MQKEGKRILNNKQIVSFLIGLLTILILIMGSSYAYFSVEVSKGSSNTIITASTEQVATASLSQGVAKLKLNLSLNNMKQSNIGNYYADDEEYYAPNKSLGYHDFATLTLSNSGQDDNIYKCESKLTLTMNGTMKDLIKDGDIKAFFIVGNQTYEVDLIKLQATGSYTIPITVELVGNSDKTIRGYIEFTNKETEQNYLAGAKLDLDIKTELLSCELTGKTAAYMINFDSNNRTALFKSDEYKDKIKKIEFVDYIDTDKAVINENGEPIKWDLTQTTELSTHKNRKSPAGSVIGWLEENGDEEVPYNLYIGSEKEIYGLNLGYAFQSMTNVETINFANFHTDIVIIMSDMFYMCRNLKKLDVSRLDTSHTTSINSMFSSINAIEELDLSNFDTSNVKNIAYMFQATTNLSSLNLRNFNTTNVTTMVQMFKESALQNIDLSSFDTLKLGANGMANMFNGSQVRKLNLSSFRTSQITNLSRTFGGLLEYLDIRNADFTNVTSYDDAFSGIKNNATIIVKDEANKDWIADKLGETAATINFIIAG